MGKRRADHGGVDGAIAKPGTRASGHAGRVTLPMLAYTYKYTSIGASGKKVTTSSAATAEAVDTLSQPGLTATVYLSREYELECLTE